MTDSRWCSNIFCFTSRKSDNSLLLWWPRKNRITQEENITRSAISFTNISCPITISITNELKVITPYVEKFIADCSFDVAQDPFCSHEMSRFWLLHITTNQPNSIENIRPCASQIAKTSHQGFEISGINIASFISW